MHTRPFALIVITAMLVLSGCSQTSGGPGTPEVAAAVPVQAAVGTFDLTLTNRAQSSLMPLAKPSAGLQPVNSSGVAVSTASTGVYDDVQSNRRYLWATFDVFNRSSTVLSNLTLVAYARSGASVGGTAVTQLLNQNGEPVINEIVARNIRPGDLAASLPASLTRNGFQGLSITEAQSLEQTALNRGLLKTGDDVLEYGFTVRNASTNGPVLAPGEQGTMTIVLKLPLQDANAPHQFTLSLMMVSGGATRVTRLVGESTPSAVSRALATGAQEVALIGPDTETAGRKLRTIRLPNVRLTTGATPVNLLDDPSPPTGCVQGLTPNALRPQATTGPLVTFISDDGTAQDLYGLLPLFREKNVVATAAVASQNMLSGDPYFATPAQVQSLQSAGWEVASHTRTHADLTTLTDAELIAEVRGAKQELEAQGLNVQNFVYPYGQQNLRVRETVCRYYRTAYIDRGADNALPVNTNYQLQRIALGSWTDPEKNTLAVYKAAVDQATARGSWLVFMLHPGNQQQHDPTQQQYLSETIDYIQSRNIPILTAREALLRLTAP